MSLLMAFALATITCSDSEIIVLSENGKNSEELADSRSVELSRISEEPQVRGKLRGFRLERLGSLPAEKEIAAIVKVSKEGYLPPGIALSARISPYLFTTRLRLADIRQLESDPAVISIELTQKLDSSGD